MTCTCREGWAGALSRVDCPVHGIAGTETLSQAFGKVVEERRERPKVIRTVCGITTIHHRRPPK